jgi:hypothetical protein
MAHMTRAILRCRNSLDIHSCFRISGRAGGERKRGRCDGGGQSKQMALRYFVLEISSMMQVMQRPGQLELCCFRCEKFRRSWRGDWAVRGTKKRSGCALSLAVRTAAQLPRPTFPAVAGCSFFLVLNLSFRVFIADCKGTGLFHSYERCLK